MLTHLIQDTTFWVALSTILFFVFLILKGNKPIVQMLDARSQTIANRIAEAERLKQEATDLLATFKAKNDAAQIEAAALLTDAQTRAQQMLEKAEADLARALGRIKDSATLRLQQAENAAINAVRGHVISKTRALAEQKIASAPQSFSTKGLLQL